MSEYGNPETDDWQFISKYSPYQNVSANRKYPTPFFTTSTKDDRVHPAYARKMVARMLEQAHEVLYFENTDGGHSGSANLEEEAKLTALEFTYLWEALR